MIRKIVKIKEINPDSTIICLGKKIGDFDNLFLTNKEKRYVKEQIKKEENVVGINRYNSFLIAKVVDDNVDTDSRLEKLRKSGSKLYRQLYSRVKFLIKQWFTSGANILASVVFTENKA